MEKHNVLFITLRSDSGGAPQHLFDLLSRFSQRDEIGVYVASPLDPPFGESFVDFAVEHFQLEHRSFSFITLLRLAFFCRRNKITTVHSHGRGAGIYSRLLKLFGYRVIHTFHGIHLGEGIVGKIKLFIDRLLKILTDVFINVSQVEVDEAIKYSVLCREKGVVVNNGVDLCKIDQLRKMKYLRNDIFTVGLLNRLNYQKGMELFIQALHSLFSHNNNLKINFVVAGDGEDRAKIEDLIRKYELNDCVELKGECRTPIDFLSSIDLFVSFARWEAAVPYSVMEAMACCKPILISKVIGHNELTVNTSAQVLFDPEDYRDFEKSLLLFYASDEICVKVGKELRAYVETNFSADNTAENTLKVLLSN